MPALADRLDPAQLDALAALRGQLGQEQSPVDEVADAAPAAVFRAPGEDQ